MSALFLLKVQLPHPFHLVTDSLHGAVSAVCRKTVQNVRQRPRDAVDLACIGRELFDKFSVRDKDDPYVPDFRKRPVFFDIGCPYIGEADTEFMTFLLTRTCSSLLCAETRTMYPTGKTW